MVPLNRLSRLRGLDIAHYGFMGRTAGHIYLEHLSPLFLGSNPPKQGPFQQKQGSFGFQVPT